MRSANRTSRMAEEGGPRSSNVAIRTFRLGMRYEGGRVALEDVSIRVEAGSLVWLLGPSGAGKSTLLKILYGAVAPTEGQAVVDGRNLARLGRADLPAFRRRLGLVFQDARLLPDRTAFENVALALEIRGLVASEVRRRAGEILERVGLAAEAGTRAVALSGGERQRVAVARALVGDPSIVLADEPTADLDHDSADAIFRLLEDARGRGATVLVATHDEARAKEENLLRLERGRVVEARGAAGVES